MPPGQKIWMTRLAFATWCIPALASDVAMAEKARPPNPPAAAFKKSRRDRTCRGGRSRGDNGFRIRFIGGGVDEGFWLLIGASADVGSYFNSYLLLWAKREHVVNQVFAVDRPVREWGCRRDPALVSVCQSTWTNSFEFRRDRQSVNRPLR